jgi:high-affinity iron transporter
VFGTLTYVIPFSIASTDEMQCCNPEISGGGGWGIFNALFGWTNSATYGSVIGYNAYWICVIVGFVALRYRETRGHWPLLKKRTNVDSVGDGRDSISSNDVEKHVEVTKVQKSMEITETK